MLLSILTPTTCGGAIGSLFARLRFVVSHPASTWVTSQRTALEIECSLKPEHSNCRSGVGLFPASSSEAESTAAFARLSRRQFARGAAPLPVRVAEPQVQPESGESE